MQPSTECRPIDARRSHQAVCVAYRCSKKMEEKQFKTDVTTTTSSIVPPSPEAAWKWQLETERYQSTTPIEPIERTIFELIDDIQRVMNAPDGEHLATRLRDLVAICEEEAPLQAPLSTTSLFDLLSFLGSLQNWICPGTVATMEGNIRCEWRHGWDRRLALEFLGDNDVRFVVMAPDLHYPLKMTRASGRATISSIIDLVKPYGVIDWVFAKGVDG